jgi:MFS family permease
MNAIYALGAYPAGAWADRMRPEPILLAGLAALIAADAALAWSPQLVFVALGLALWGVHMALTQGLLSKLVAESAPAAMRATAFGAFNASCGAATLAASVVAGVLWDAMGPASAFLAGAAFAAAAALGVMRLWRAAEPNRG